MPKFALTKKQQTVQTLVELDAQITALLDQRNAIVDKLKAKGPAKIVGLTHYLNITEHPHSTLVPERVAKILTPAQMKKCTKTTKHLQARLYSL